MTASTRSIDLIGVGTTKLAAGVADSLRVALDAANTAGWRETGPSSRRVAHTSGAR
jgi:hypothetical protein